ncbi:peptide ABC transporter substrate-binding protein [Micromonosporaceae bacterium Da 78-11]
MRTRPVWRPLVGLTMLALLMSACGGKAKTEDTSGDNATITTNILEPEKLITTFANELQGITVLHALYKGLIDYDATTGDPVNVIADSITSSDSKTWLIKIKPGWKFDNGEAVDADSFIREWNYSAYSPNVQDNAHFFDKIVGFEDLQSVDPDGEDGPQKAPTPKASEMSGLKKVDDLSFSVTLKSPFASFPRMLGYNAFYPNAKACIADMKACNEKPIGDGPFKMEGSWQHNQQIKLVRSDTYAGPEAKVGHLTFRIYDTIDTAYTDMLAGELDVLNSVPASKYKEAVGKFGDAMLRVPTSDFTYLSVPYYVTAFKNVKTRQALSMAIDRQPIIDALFDGSFVPAKSVISPAVGGSRTDACQYCTFDPAKAKQYLAAAGGWPAGQKLELWCNSGGGHEKWLQAIGDQVKKNLGIDYEIKCDLPFAQYLGQLLDPRKTTGPFRMRWQMDYPATEDYLRPLYTKGAPGNFEDYDNPKVDELVHQGDMATTTAAQLQQYQAAEDIVLQDMPIIPLWFGVSSVVKGDHAASLTYNKAIGVDWATLAYK